MLRTHFISLAVIFAAVQLSASCQKSGAQIQAEADQARTNTNADASP
jgi:hypothetical protein